VSFRCPACGKVTALGPTDAGAAGPAEPKTPLEELASAAAPRPGRRAPAGYRAHAPMRTAPGAVASLVCGILGLLCFGFLFGPIAIILATQARGAVRRGRGIYSGDGLAIAGLVLGIIGTALHAVWLVFFLMGLAAGAA